MLNFDDLPPDLSKVWVLCEEPLWNFQCNIPSRIKEKWILIDNKNTYLLKAKLFEANNI